MAPFSNYISFLLLTILLLPLQTIARDNQFFNKETKVPNKQESTVTNKAEQPPFIPQTQNSYGLYGHHSDHLPSNFEDTSNYPNNEEGYSSMMKKQNNNNQKYYFNNNAANGDEKQGMSDTEGGKSSIPVHPQSLIEPLGRSRLRSPPPPQSPPPPPVAPLFDHFLLVLSWPQAFCKELQSTGKTCITPPINFTLHGLWPSRIENCDTNNNYPFDFQKVVRRVGENQLNKDWPSLVVTDKTVVSRRNDNIFLWSEQWKKHGTCSLPILIQEEYFSTALKLYNGMNVRNMLQMENIIPSRTTTVDVQAISNAIVHQMQWIPQIRCQVIQNINYLYEIRFCLTASNDPLFKDCARETVGCDNSDVIF